MRAISSTRSSRVSVVQRRARGLAVGELGDAQVIVPLRRRPAAGASRTAPGARSPSARSSRPTISATAPPMPASTSSNTMQGASSAARAATCTARLRRDSSPPEATFASGRSGWPGLAVTGIRSGRRRAARLGGASGLTSTWKRPPAMPSVCMRVVMSLPSRAAAARRAAESLRAGARGTESAAPRPAPCSMLREVDAPRVPAAASSAASSRCALRQFCGFDAMLARQLFDGGEAPFHLFLARGSTSRIRA